MEFWVFHVDMDAFFASVSLLSHPSLLELPVVVAGDPEQRHGVVLAKNQKAKSLGIKTAMSLAEAKRLVPNLSILPPEHDKYHDYSKKAQEIYRQHCHFVESFGLDECWLALECEDPLLFAKNLQKEIYDTLGLTISVGVAKDKVLAKLASDMQKPQGLVLIAPEDLQTKVWPLAVEKLLFVGKIAREKLNNLGVNTIGELARCPVHVLVATLGKTGTWLHDAANGLNQDPVKPADFKEQRKSISSMETLASDLDNADAARKILDRQLGEVVDSLKKQNLRSRSVQIWYKTADFQSYTRQASLAYATDEYELLYRAMLVLLHDEVSFERPIRAIGVGLSLLESNTIPQQLSLEDLAVQASNEETNTANATDAKKSALKAKQVQSLVDQINQNYGSKIVSRGLNDQFLE